MSSYGLGDRILLCNAENLSRHILSHHVNPKSLPARFLLRIIVRLGWIFSAMAELFKLRVRKGQCNGYCPGYSYVYERLWNYILMLVHGISLKY
jgi:hypothetical protein